jgi:hypothetical protein
MGAEKCAACRHTAPVCLLTTLLLPPLLLPLPPLLYTAAAL